MTINLTCLWTNIHVLREQLGSTSAIIEAAVTEETANMAKAQARGLGMTQSNQSREQE